MNAGNRRGRRVRQLAGLIFTLATSGCLGSNTGPPPPREKPLAGTDLRVNCSDELRPLVQPMARIWAHETGATVTVSAEPIGDETDVAILPMAELGRWADRGDLLPIPLAMREPGHPSQWSGLLPGFRGEAYAGWGSQVFAIPFVTETPLLVHRADRFSDPAVQAAYQKKFGRPLTAPASWEALADTAAFFAELDKMPSLPAMDPARLEDLFFRAAASYDRSAGAGDSREEAGAVGFAFDLKTGRPRLQAPSMEEAAKWLASLKTRGCLPSEGRTDSAAALTEGRAVIAVCSLGDLLKLNPEHRRTGRFGLAAMPGAQRFVNPATGKLVPVQLNRVPYLSGGWVGVVKRGSKSPEAAFALLAEIAGPARSQEIVAAGGFAPVREAQLEPDRLVAWLGYGFDEKTTKQLQEIVRTNLGAAVRSPVYGLRSPDEAELRKELRAELVKIANGSAAPAEALKRVNDQWGSVLHPEWRRRAAGLN